MIGLGILKQTEANLIKVTNGVKNEFRKIKDELPQNIKFMKAMIHLFCFRSIKRSLSPLLCSTFGNYNNFIFLKNFRTLLIPFLTVPISILSTFIFLNLFGYTINLITLLALVLCTGLVIDDSIVTLENIYKKVELGSSKIEAAIQGSKEVFLQLFPHRLF